MSTSQEPDFAGPPPWKSPGFIVAAVLIGLIIAAGVIVALKPDRTQNWYQPNPRARQSAFPTTDASSPSVTGQPTSVPTTAPPGVEWRLLGQVPLPYSHTDGPRSVTDTTASGYAHTPTGALIAARQLTSRAGISAGKAVYEPTITQQFVASPDRDRLLELLRNAPQTPSEPGSLSTLVGFQYLAYSPDTAVIGLVRRAPGTETRYFISTVTLQWRDNDWRMVAPPGGIWQSNSRQATTLQGVVEWGAR